MTAPGLSPKQEEFMRGSNARVNILEGSIRSGKTIVSLLRWLIYVAMAPKGGELVMVGRTRDSIWRNVIAPLQNPQLFGPLAQHVVGNFGAPTVTILGVKIWVLGASDSKAELVLRGLTVSGAYVDEITTLSRAFFTQLLGRMSVPGAQLFGTTNPDNPSHWFKTEYLDRAEKLGWTVWHFTIDDNLFLDPIYVASIKAEYTGLWYKRFIDGLWVAAEGAIYDMWDPDKHVIAWDDLPAMQTLYATGIDYGTTNATSAIVLGLGIDNRLYLVNEWRLDSSNKGHGNWTDAQQSSAILKWLHDTELAPGCDLKPQWTVVDPAAASFKVQLDRDGGWGIANAENDVLYGIRLLANGLAGGWLKIADKCKGFITEAPGYAWDSKAQDEGEDKPIKLADHSLDAGRYALATTENLWRSTIDYYVQSRRERIDATPS